MFNKARVSYWPVLDSSNEEIDEPSQGVLVHRINVGKVGDGEKQDGGMNSDWIVACSWLVDFFLRFFCNLKDREI